MNRQIAINIIIGSFFGYAAQKAWLSGEPSYGILLYTAFLIAVINSLIPVKDK